MAIGLFEGIVALLQEKIPFKAPAFLPGIYAYALENEFYRIDDTLIIRRTRMEEDDYRVTRGTRIVRIIKGKKGVPESQQQQWQGHYTAIGCQLVSSNEADTIYYYPEKNRVSKASFYYEKIE